jgi:hypothetical protein
LKIELGIPKEKAGLARRLTAMPEHLPRITNGSYLKGRPAPGGQLQSVSSLECRP